MASLKISVILQSGASIGPDKAALLEGVRDKGSILGAARSLGMDYKRAWLLIDSLNRAFDTPVVARAQGGGGGAILTAFGADILERYRRLEEATIKLGAVELRALERRALPAAAVKA